MNVNDVFAGNYLKVEMLKGRAATLTINKAELAKFDEGNKIAIGFQETEKELVLNKTNAYAVAMMYGEETGGWMGKKIEIFPDTTLYQGKMTPCIRVRAPQGMPAAQPAQSYQGNPSLPPSKQAEAMADDRLSGAHGLDDDIPFAPLRELP